MKHKAKWSGFLDVADAYTWFQVEVNSFQTGKGSLQVSASSIYGPRTSRLGYKSMENWKVVDMQRNYDISYYLLGMNI